MSATARALPRLRAVPARPKATTRKTLRPRDPNATKAAERRRTVRRARAATLAFIAGIPLGGIIPTLVWSIAHYQTQTAPWLWLAVAGGLAYSAPIVATWFSGYVGLLKGWSFAASLEIAMTLTTGWTSLAALTVLITLNAYVLAGILQKRTTEKLPT